MPKRVLDIGQCGPDHATIRAYLTRNFDCEVVQAHDAADALAKLKGERFDLALVNRKRDVDYSDGIEVIRELKADPDASRVPGVLATSCPERLGAAIARAAVRGSG